MSFRLIDTDWDREIAAAASNAGSDLRIVCPFIKHRALTHLVRGSRAISIKVITRFCLGDMFRGVSDSLALRVLLERGAQVRGVRNLHAKLYLFDESAAILTSANLTLAGLSMNHELGFVASEKPIVGECSRYFSTLWARSGEDLTINRLEEWERRLTRCLLRSKPPETPSELTDEGVEVGYEPSPLELHPPHDAARAFVKFLGEGNNREAAWTPVLNEVERAGCHWACAWPKKKRPRSVADGDALFIGRLVKNPDDVLIFGRAVALKHLPSRDDASESEIRDRPWKARWPHYIRVHHAEFIAGQLANGVSMNELMGELEWRAFRATQRNVAAGEGNRDPRLSVRQQAAVELSCEGRGWLSDRFENAVQRYGTIPQAVLRDLDWPDPDSLT